MARDVQQWARELSEEVRKSSEAMKKLIIDRIALESREKTYGEKFIFVSNERGQRKIMTKEMWDSLDDSRI